jgi:hypothetical protein
MMLMNTNALRDSGILMSGIAAVSAVTIGGIVYYNIPTWNQHTMTSTLANLITMPFFVAGQASVKLGQGMLGAVGYQSSATQKASRDERIAQSQIPGTPEYSAKILYALMQMPGAQDQLQATQITILGSGNVDWNQAVNEVYSVMFGEKLEYAIVNYMSMVK